MTKQSLNYKKLTQNMRLPRPAEAVLAKTVMWQSGLVLTLLDISSDGQDES
ncbi:MAG: hypothetical protein IIB40_01985 [Candidatus Marinimicrobia bacterium]|nr:hypothetical protein [Candidatus Neomarinimicrobiota bacterium]